MMLITGHKGCIGRELSKRTKYIGYDRENNPAELQNMIGDSHIVIHLAALTDVGECEQYPKEAYRDNVALTSQIAFLCREMDKKVIYTSSCAVYGDSYPHIEPIGNYGFTKKVGEDVLKNQMGMDKVSILRLTNVFGIPKGVLHLIKTAKKPLKIYGNPFRNFIHVHDVCEVIMTIAKQFRPGTFDIGNYDTFSVRDLASKYTQIIEQPPLPFDIQYSQVNTHIGEFIKKPLRTIKDYLL